MDQVLDGCWQRSDATFSEIQSLGAFFATFLQPLLCIQVIGLQGMLLFAGCWFGLAFSWMTNSHSFIRWWSTRRSFLLQIRHEYLEFRPHKHEQSRGELRPPSMLYQMLDARDSKWSMMTEMCICNRQYFRIERWKSLVWFCKARIGWMLITKRYKK